MATTGAGGTDAGPRRERTSVRLAAFALAVVVVFALAYAAGAAYGPSTEVPGTPDAPTHSDRPAAPHAEEDDDHPHQ